jgi:hypothetical protein
MESLPRTAFAETIPMRGFFLELAVCQRESAGAQGAGEREREPLQEKALAYWCIE